jgi:hypothetical protein
MARASMNSVAFFLAMWGVGATNCDVDSTSPECSLDDEVSLLQTEVNKTTHQALQLKQLVDSSVFKKARKTRILSNKTEQYPVASMVPDCGHVCYQGPAFMIPHVLTSIRMSVGAGLYEGPRDTIVQNVSCASRGYTVLEDDPDDCWAPAQKWVRDHSAMQDWQQAQMANWQGIADREGIDLMRVVAAGGCTCLRGYRCPPPPGPCERETGWPGEAATTNFCGPVLEYSPSLLMLLLEIDERMIPFHDGPHGIVAPSSANRAGVFGAIVLFFQVFAMRVF